MAGSSNQSVPFRHGHLQCTEAFGGFTVWKAFSRHPRDGVLVVVCKQQCPFDKHRLGPVTGIPDAVYHNETCFKKDYFQAPL